MVKRQKEKKISVTGIGMGVPAGGSGDKILITFISRVFY